MNKSIKYLLLVFVYTKTIATSFGQITFQKESILSSGQIHALSVQQTSEGKYIHAGLITTSGGFNEIFLIKNDSNGDTLWTKTFGANNYELGATVKQTSDGGFIILGSTLITGSGNNMYLVKTNFDGDIQWSKAYVNSTHEIGRDIKETPDSGFVILGTNSIIKTDFNGDTIWTKYFGNAVLNEDPQAIENTSDRGFIITGMIDSIGSPDIFITKLDTNGNVIWTNIYGGLSLDRGLDIKQSFDGGYIIAGNTHSFGSGNVDAYILKTDSNGVLEWSKTIGGTSGDKFYEVQLDPDGGFVFIGEFVNPNGGGIKSTLIKTNNLGDTLWSNPLSNGNGNIETSFGKCSDGGFIVATKTPSNTGLLIKTDSLGNTSCNESNFPKSISNPATVSSSILFESSSTNTIITNLVTIESGGIVQTTICSNVSVDEIIPENRIQLFPNPASSTITISASDEGSFQPLAISVYDLTGKLRDLKIIKIRNDVLLDINFLPIGIYFVKIEARTGIGYKKFIKI